jgi:hypothetical protein
MWNRSIYAMDRSTPSADRNSPVTFGGNPLPKDPGLIDKEQRVYYAWLCHSWLPDLGSHSFPESASQGPTRCRWTTPRVFRETYVVDKLVPVGWQPGCTLSPGSHRSYTICGKSATNVSLVSPLPGSSVQTMPNLPVPYLGHTKVASDIPTNCRQGGGKIKSCLLGSR